MLCDVSLLKRLFFADYRRGLSFEAAGNYLEAARAYALAGESNKVAAMHVACAEEASDFDARQSSYRVALRFVDTTADGRALSGRIAHALANLCDQSPVLSPTHEEILRQAGRVFESVGDHAAAAECYTRLGDHVGMARAYEQAGAVDKLEPLLAEEEQQRHLGAQFQSALADFRLHDSLGARRQAAQDLDIALRNAAPEQRSEIRQLATEVAQKRCVGQATLRDESGKTVTYIGTSALVFGRDPDCTVVLRDLGISRKHAEITISTTGVALRDLGSKNLTLLNGVAITDDCALADRGEFSLGEHCRIAFTLLPSEFSFTVAAGVDHGLYVRCATNFSLAPFGELRFRDGDPVLHSTTPLRLNGRSTVEVELARGDKIEKGDSCLEVL